MEARECGQPFRHWVIDDGAPCPPILLKEVLAEIPPPSWGGWVRYNNDCEWRKRTCNDLQRLGQACESLFWYLSSASWIGQLQDLTGIRGLQADPCMHGGGIHATDPGGWLQPHLDYALHPKLPGLERRLNLILFLNPEWSNDDWGGAFQLFDDQAHDVAGVVTPEFGRIVLWEPTDTAFHGTGRVTCPGNKHRLTAACYYLAPARPTATRKRALFVPRRDAA